MKGERKMKEVYAKGILNQKSILRDQFGGYVYKYKKDANFYSDTRKLEVVQIYDLLMRVLEESVNINYWFIRKAVAEKYNEYKSQMEKLVAEIEKE